MSDVDAVRFLASEHDLEFVNLDTYNVDYAAAEALPVAVARRHHVVAVKKKFGTPVIAIANPNDVFALDTVRASLGRDFISVVASRDQILRYLDKVYGPEDSESAESQVATGEPSVEGANFQGDELSDDEDDLDGSFGMSLYGSAFAQLPEEENAPPAATASSSNGSGSDVYAAPEVPRPPIDPPMAPVVEPMPEDPKNPEPLEITTAEEESISGAAAEFLADISSKVNESQHAEQRNEPESIRHEEETIESNFGASESVGSSGPPEISSNGASDHPADIQPLPTIEPPANMEDLVQTIEHDDDSIAERLSSELPQFDLAELKFEPSTIDESRILGFNPVVDGLPDSSAAFAASEDALVEFARAAEQPGGEDEQGDQGVMTADLVDEAVTHYEEQHSENSTPDVVAEGGSTLALPELAKVLLGGGRVSMADIELVIEEHERTGQSVARILTNRKLVTEADLMWGMAQEMGLEFVDLDTLGINATATSLLPEATAKHHNVLVIANEGGTPVIAASNPTDVFALDDLRTIIGRNFVTVVATRSQISTYIRRAYHGGGDAADMAKTASLDYDKTNANVEDIQAVTEEAPIVRYVNLLVLQALNERASDIHVEPTAKDLRIRYRIDGVLHDVSTAPRSIAAAVTTRLKVMADMNIAEHRVPQDGRISLNVGDKGVDLRMATLPTIHGEKIVMRVLDMSSIVLGFSDLGFDEDLLEIYENIFSKPYGRILVTGPTGSGKSTTLYTTLAALNSPEKNIITVEDPVELQISGINQVQLNVKAGLTFASALKSILRSDPDIVLVGEIRDKETAVIAIEAALTGHLVLATLHTNSASSTPMRLIEMGLEAFLVTSSLSAVLAQRLARRLCIHCKEPCDLTEADVVAAGWSMEEIQSVGDVKGIHKAVGCSACSNTGYRGRKAIAELMPMTEEIERMIIEGGSVEDIHRLAVSQGMVTLRQSGLRKAIAGETTLEEVLRVVA